MLMFKTSKMWLTYIAFTRISIHTSKIIEKIVKKTDSSYVYHQKNILSFQCLISSPYYIKVKNPLALEGYVKVFKNHLIWEVLTN